MRFPSSLIKVYEFSIITVDDKSKSDSMCLFFPKLRDTLFTEKPAITINLIPRPQSYENEVMSVEDYTETGNYLSITRLVLSVLTVTIVAKRHSLETAFFLKGVPLQRGNYRERITSRKVSLFLTS